MSRARRSLRPVRSAAQENLPVRPAPGLAELRAAEPITRRVMPLDGTELWLVTSHDLVRRMLADPRWSSSLDGGLSPEQPLHVTQPEPGMFISMDAPEHGRYRRMLTAHFTVQRMNRLRPRIEQIVAERLDAMERLPRPVDLVAEFALPVPSLVICELLGMPYEDRAEFQAAARVIVDMTASPEQIDAAVAGLAAHLAKLIAAKREEPDDALIGELIREGALTDGELVQISMLLLVAGHETTANMLGLGTLLLLHHPDQLALVREGAPGAADELLRYLSIVDLVMFRGAKEDLTLGGQEIKAGSSAWPRSRRPTATPRSARTPTGSTSPGPRPRTSRWASARTSASGRTSPGWSWRSPSRRCCGASPG
nr:hypothetical protein GCM10020093_040930 [Planobispora longispora]